MLTRDFWYNPKFRLCDPFCSDTFRCKSAIFSTLSMITGLGQKYYSTKFHYFCKIYNFAEENFNVGTIFCAKIQKNHLGTVAKCWKVSLMQALSPKYELNKKKKFCIFFLTTYWKKLGHQNNYLGVYSSLKTTGTWNTLYENNENKLSCFDSIA